MKWVDANEHMFMFNAFIWHIFTLFYIPLYKRDLTWIPTNQRLLAWDLLTTTAFLSVRETEKALLQTRVPSHTLKRRITNRPPAELKCHASSLFNLMPPHRSTPCHPVTRLMNEWKGDPILTTFHAPLIHSPSALPSKPNKHKHILKVNPYQWP